MNNTLTQKQQFWKTHLDAAERSGLSIADYAKANQLKPQTLYQWRSTLETRTYYVDTKGIVFETEYGSEEIPVPETDTGSINYLR